jgi:small neutral amino acid transporter SnatA (MarC family)
MPRIHHIEDRVSGGQRILRAAAEEENHVDFLLGCGILIAVWAILFGFASAGFIVPFLERGVWPAASAVMAFFLFLLGPGAVTYGLIKGARGGDLA